MLRLRFRRRPPQIRDRVGLIGLLAITSLMLSACSGSASVGTTGREDGPSAAPTAAPMAAPTAVGIGAEPPADGIGGSTGSGGEQVVSQVGQAGPLIVRTGNLAIEVADLDATILKARGRIAGLGGYVSDSERVNAGEGATALITYRVPAERWEEALDSLRGYASRVLSEQTRAVEITGQVLDLGARIENLRTTEHALQAIMAQATKISDILDVQNQLTNVRGEIEQLSTQKAHLGDQAALGTLAVTYSLPVVALAQAASGWNLAAEFDRAAAQLVQIGQGLAVTAVWLGVLGLPILLGALLLWAVVVLVGRRFGLVRTSGPSLPSASG